MRLEGTRLAPSWQINGLWRLGPCQNYRAVVDYRAVPNARRACRSFEAIGARCGGRPQGNAARVTLARCGRRRRGLLRKIGS